jgi:hypothetical protein
VTALLCYSSGWISSGCVGEEWMGSESSAFIYDKVPGESFELVSVFFPTASLEGSLGFCSCQPTFDRRRIIERQETSDVLIRGC